MKNICLSKTILFCLGVAFLFWHGCTNSDQELRVGVILPLSGDWANFGEKMRRGVELWVKKHPDAKVKICVEDGKGSAAGSVAAFNKLVNFNKVTAFITGVSSAVLGMAPLADRNKVFMVNAGATNPKIKELSPYVFTIIPDADVEARCIAKFLLERRNCKSVYILWKNDESGKGMMATFSNEFEKYGGAIKGSDPIGEVSGIVPVLLKVKNSGVSTVFIPANGELVSRVIKQAVSMGMSDVLWVGYAATESPDLIRDLSGITNLNLIFSTYAFDSEDSTNKNMKNFVESYRKQYGEIPPYYSATCYDAMDLIHKLSQKSFPMLDALKAQKELKGVSGDLAIEENFVSSGISFKKLGQTGMVRIKE